MRLDLEAIKSESEAELAAMGVQVNWNLPILAELNLRSPMEVARRAAALHALAAVGQGAPPGFVRAWLSKNGLDGVLSPREHNLLGQVGLSPREGDDLLWGAESAWTLSWVLGRVEEELSFQQFAPKVTGLWPDLRKGEALSPYLQGLTLRPMADIARKLDFAFRLHWAVNDAALMGTPFPVESVHPDLVVERHRALQWTVSAGVPWDEVDLSV